MLRCRAAVLGTVLVSLQVAGRALRPFVCAEPDVQTSEVEYVLYVQI